jgi:epoxyqueuosine reductase
MKSARRPFTPDPAQMVLWPGVSGNDINGRGEAAARRPSPIYWHRPEATAHGALQKWFYTRSSGAAVAEARALRQQIIDQPLAPLATAAVERSAGEWSAAVKDVCTAAGAEDAGIAALRPEWVFEGYETPRERWLVVIAVAHDYDKIRAAPEEAAAAEVIRQYARGNRIAKALASWLRVQGHDAVPHGGPMAGPITLIPPAIACGMGELGKHGSLIHRRLGANFRLASVLTDVPLVADAPDVFGADDFCLHCRVCEDACPPEAIEPGKQLVRGEKRWYVDFDKCLPYFNETQGCAICIAVCPWSRPGVAETLVAKRARRRARP